MNNVIDINQYTPNKGDKFFFDANIWLYLYCPLGNYNKDVSNQYSNFFKKVLQVKSTIFISSLVLSEFFNAWVKLDFDIFKKYEPLKYNDFKTSYRNTKLYENQVLTIKTVITKYIMQIAKRIDDKFRNISLDKLFKEIEKSDFNDKYYITLANLEKFKIVTNDSDFAFSKEISTSILTANRKILKRV